MSTREQAEERAVGIAKRCSAGETLDAIADDLGISVARIRHLQLKGERIERIRTGQPIASTTTKAEERAVGILKRCIAGETLKVIGNDLGISAPRVRQLRMKGERIEQARVLQYERKFGP